MRYGSLEIVAYKRVNGEVLPPEMASNMSVIRNGEHVFGSPVPIRTYETVDNKLVYTKFPFAISETDDLVLLFENVEDGDADVTVYVYFYNATANPIGVGYATTLKKMRTGRCSVKEQTGL
jgi:hypothetical protein